MLRSSIKGSKNYKICRTQGEVWVRWSLKNGGLRILTRKKHRRKNSSAYKKNEYGHLRCWYIKSAHCKSS